MKHRMLRGEKKRKVIELYGDRCINCGEAGDIEWHHVVPLSVGGNDIPSNIVPLCRRCHKAVTFDMPVVMAHLRDKKAGGRPKKWPENYKDIVDDYIMCRISKSECSFRLGRNGSGYTYLPEFRERLKAHGIKAYRNQINTILSHNDAVYPGQIVGHIEFENGEKRYIKWLEEEPLSGKSDVPTKEHPTDYVRVRKVEPYWNPFT